jgi:hypothetical protein
MVKSDLMDAYTIKGSSCGSKPNWALVHMCTCKAAANRSNVPICEWKFFYIKILPIPKTMQGSKEERSKKKNLLKVRITLVVKNAVLSKFREIVFSKFNLC